MRGLVLGLALSSGCHVAFPIDSGGSFCERSLDQGALFCADFDAPDGDPYAPFMKLDDQPGEIYELDEIAPRSAPRAGVLAITGPGSPDARIARVLPAEPRLSALAWLRVSSDESNRVVLARLALEETTNRNIFVTNNGGIVEQDLVGSRSIGQLTPPPHDRWFALGFDIDFATGAGEVHVDGETAPFAIAPALEESRRLQLGPAEPYPENTGSGWRVAVDDVAVYADAPP